MKEPNAGLLEMPPNGHLIDTHHNMAIEPLLNWIDNDTLQLGKGDSRVDWLRKVLCDKLFD